MSNTPSDPVVQSHFEPRPGSSLPRHADYLFLLMEPRDWPSQLALVREPDVQEWLSIRFAIAQREGGLQGRDPARVFIQLLELIPDDPANEDLSLAWIAVFLCAPELLGSAWNAISVWINGLIPSDSEPTEDSIQRAINLLCDEPVFPDLNR